MKRLKRCIGFGKWEGRCDKEPDWDLNSSGLWCTDCERERRKRISAQFAKIEGSFSKRGGGVSP